MSVMWIDKRKKKNILKNSKVYGGHLPQGSALTLVEGKKDTVSSDPGIVEEEGKGIHEVSKSHRG